MQDRCYGFASPVQTGSSSTCLATLYSGRTGWSRQVEFENISTVCPGMSKTISLSTIQLAPKIYRSKGQMPRQTSPLAKLLRRKYLLGLQSTISPSISISMSGKISLSFYLMVIVQLCIILQQEGLFLATRHFSGTNAQAFSKATSKLLKFERGKQVKVLPESMKKPNIPANQPSLWITLSPILISPTFQRLYKFLPALKVVLTEVALLCSSSLGLPITSWPPFLARQRLNIRRSPVAFECFWQRRSKSRAWRLGARPKIPLAAWVKKRLVSLVVHPKAVVMDSPTESDSNCISSSMMMPESELPSAQDIEKVQGSVPPF